MIQFMIKLSTLADVYAVAKSVLDTSNRVDEDAENKIKLLESEFDKVILNAMNKTISRIIEFKYIDYPSVLISVTEFLRCYYEAYKSKSEVLEDLLFMDDSELKISYQGLTAIYGELLVDSIIANSINRGNNVFLVG